MGKATDIINKCFLIQDKIEKNEGARSDRCGNYNIPLRGKKTYVYDDSNSLDDSAEGRIITKANDLTAGASMKNAGSFSNDTVYRNRKAAEAERRYLTPTSRASSRRIHTPETARVVDQNRQNPDGNIIVPKELLGTMKELVEQNKILKAELDLLQEERFSNKIQKSSVLRAPKRRIK